MYSYYTNDDGDSSFCLDDDFSDEEMWDLDDQHHQKKYMDAVNIDIYVHKPRNTCHRPGGTNPTECPDYWESAWGKMLKDPTLQVSGSDLRKTFSVVLEFHMYCTTNWWNGPNHGVKKVCVMHLEGI